MGRMCAWCGTVLRAVAASNQPVSHVLCSGCLEELRLALNSSGVRLCEGAGQREA